jgi:hypothetical protein
LQDLLIYLCIRCLQVMLQWLHGSVLYVCLENKAVLATAHTGMSGQASDHGALITVQE